MRQAQIAQNTSPGTSDTNSKAKRAKTEKPIDLDLDGGNPLFNVNHVQATAAITDEDLAFERELARMEAETPIASIDEDRTVPDRPRKERNEPLMLAEFVEDYKPAKTLTELRDQVFHAKQYGCDSIEGSKELIRHFTKPHFPDDVGYFMYDSVKVWIPGFFETHKHYDSMTIEQKLFPKREAKN